MANQNWSFVSRVGFQFQFYQCPSCLSKRQTFDQKLIKKNYELAKSIEKSMEKSFPASEFPVGVHHAHKSARHCEIGKAATPSVTKKSGRHRLSLRIWMLSGQKHSLQTFLWSTTSLLVLRTVQGTCFLRMFPKCTTAKH